MNGAFRLSAAAANDRNPPNLTAKEIVPKLTLVDKSDRKRDYLINVNAVR